MVGRELELVWGFARVRRNVALLGGCYVGPVLGLISRRVTGCGSVAEFVIRDERCGG